MHLRIAKQLVTIQLPMVSFHDMISPPVLDRENTRDLLSQCIHCGLCLPACPTYAVFHTEMEGPRGRIALMQAAADSRIQLNGAFQEHIELCLGCRACETACPSGVQYGRLVEVAREALEQELADVAHRALCTLAGATPATTAHNKTPLVGSVAALVPAFWSATHGLRFKSAARPSAFNARPIATPIGRLSRLPTTRPGRGQEASAKLPSSMVAYRIRFCPPSTQPLSACCSAMVSRFISLRRRPVAALPACTLVTALLLK